MLSEAVLVNTENSFSELPGRRKGKLYEAEKIFKNVGLAISDAFVIKFKMKDKR